MSDSTVLQIKASQFKRLVEPVLPFADKGDTLPILEAVMFRSHGGRLYAHATDRYRLGVQRVEAEVADGLTFLLASKSIRAILNLYRGTKLHDPDLVLTVTADSLRVAGAGSLGFSSDSYTTWPLTPGDYPTVGTLITQAATRALEGVAPTSVNAAFLGDFKMAAVHAEGIEPVRMWTSPNKPNLIRVGDDFIGVLMPVRYTGDADRGPALGDDWAALLAVGEMKGGTALVETVKPGEAAVAVKA